jgi:hypothetical protein
VGGRADPHADRAVHERATAGHLQARPRDEVRLPRMGTTLAGVALASIGLLLAYGDDDDWKKREDWDRDNYWWFKVGGIAFRIPKPFEIGAVGTLAERSLEYMIDKEMTGKRFRERIAARSSTS